MYDLDIMDINCIKIRDPIFFNKIPNHTNKISSGNFMYMYFTGKQYKAIAIPRERICLVIYDEFYESNEKIQISIIYCPFSKSCMVYEGNVDIHTDIINNNITLLIKAHIISHMSGINISTKKHTHIRKWDTKYITLLDLMQSHNNVQYLDTSKYAKQYTLKCTYHKLKHNLLRNKMDDDCIVFGLEIINLDNKREHICVCDNNVVNISKFISALHLNIKQHIRLIIATTYITWISSYPNTHVLIL
jgi:hypothetical protein